MSKPITEVTARLESWYIDSRQFGDEMILWGFIYDDIEGRFGDGSAIHTSGIKRCVPATGDIVVTHNSSYLLGKPYTDRDFLKEKDNGS